MPRERTERRKRRALKRNILLITTDQMRFDALGCNGGEVARTPVIDELAKKGINYTRAHNQNVVCMPARATIITGQTVRSHGVWMNGVSLPEETRTVAHELRDAGYHTALLGKAHFEPWLAPPEQFFENRMASEGNTGPHRGFDHMELANHFFEGHSHYDLWMTRNHPDAKARFYPMMTSKGQNTASNGQSGAVQVWPMDVPRELYHTDWVADRTIDWLSSLSSLADDAPFFCWMSFPDPHHPWDVPKSELGRLDWRDVPLPRLFRENPDEQRAMLEGKPRHWLGYYEGSMWTNLESPREFIPANMTADQVREINAMTHIENELIDEACGRVLHWLTENGLREKTDIFFTSDHGELQGDFGLLFKGPYHVDALMRLPFIWQPAPEAGVAPAVVDSPVGHLDLAATFCELAGIPTPATVEGEPLPTESNGRATMLTEWDSEHGPVNMHLQSLYRADGYLVTRYEKGSLYDGTEGELYNLNDDPDQVNNLWSDAGHASLRKELVEQLDIELAPRRDPQLPRRAPV